MGNLRQKYTDEEWDNLPSELAKQLNKSEKQGGFFDLPQDTRCKEVYLRTFEKSQGMQRRKNYLQSNG